MTSGNAGLTTALAASFGLLIAVACRDDGGGGAAVELRGGERLAWDQAASSLEELRSLTFRLYADDKVTVLFDPRCGEIPAAAGYPCSAGLPPLPEGSNTLQLTSVLNGVESPRSAPILVTVRSTRGVPPPAPARGAGDNVNPTSTLGRFVGPPNVVPDAAVASTITCSAGPQPGCHPASVLASGLDGASGLGPTPDGRLLFIEGGTRIRLIADGALTPGAALAFNDPSVRIVGLAVDPAFAASRTVFVAFTERTSSATVALSIARYREVNGTLGQGATIVGGLPVPEGALAPLAVDQAGLLYLALPATGAPPADSAGVVMRFTGDGLTPPSNPRASPILGYGYSRPTSLAPDSANLRLWLSGERAGWGNGLATLPLNVGTAAPWPIPPESAVLEQPDGRPMSQLLIVSGQELHQLSLGADGLVTGVDRLSLSPTFPVVAAIQSASGLRYVAVDTGDGRAAVFRIH